MAAARLLGNAGRTVARVGSGIMALAGIGVLSGNL
jgi:hypothetical protein